MELQQLKLMLTVSQGLLKAQKKQKIYTSKLEPLHRICIRWAIQKSSKFFFFFSLFFRSLLRWKLLIKRVYWLSRNMLQHRPISFRCTKVAVLNIGGTLSYLSLKSTNKKKQFFRLPDFWIFLLTFWSQKFLYFEVLFIRTECPICDYTVNEFFNLCELIAM